ncbi:protein TbuX (plasmid) [Cupriavidus necator N-1]|uniref:Protein TbuX n=1 Tax=Cupriavidus necator (strain ATCC 43291 / DSM 13513 / CCUG 52238 / LMG 8453 / N-1) TaxID=1042878 RepID=F8GVL1_CUPNN|nr:outer membrane protein transport protein [Cupriavidus necator]AEI82631.1 protein TbuX [Cupriavidus necator N-1]MDX6007628.1 outer membrane protein transport protein [Cupriavidus necator]
MKCRYARVASAICAAVLCPHANATEVFNMEGYGPISRGMGGIGVAYDIGSAAMMLNPATLGLMPEGKHISIGLDVVNTDIKVTNTATGESVHSGKHGSNNGPYFAPELAFVYRRNPYAFGVGVFAEGGVGTQYGSSSFLSRTTTNSVDTGLDNFSRLLVLRIPFSAAYNVTDKLTVGGSLDVVWTALNVGMLLDASQIGGLAAANRVSGTLVPALLGIPGLSGGHIRFSRDGLVGGGADAWGVAGKLGMTYQLAPSTRIGVAYSSKTAVGDLRGNATLNAVSATAGNIPVSGTIVVRNFQMPAQFSLGISHDITDNLTVAADYQRIFWASTMKNINIGFTSSGNGANLNISLPQNYRDTNVFGVGASYRINSKWTFRGGVRYAQEAIPGDSLLAVIPATPTTHLSTGASYAIGKDDILDFALSLALQKTLTNPGGTNSSVPIRTEHSQLNAVIAYRKRF